MKNVEQMKQMVEKVTGQQVMVIRDTEQYTEFYNETHMLAVMNANGELKFMEVADADRYSKIKKIEALDDAAEDENVSLNEFIEMVKEAEQPTNSIEDFNECLRAAAERLGFETEAPDGRWFKFTRIKSDYVNFQITEDHSGSDWKNRIERVTFEAQASISTMGGNPTVEELTKAADEIRCAAILMKKVNDWRYTIEERF